MKPTTLIAFAAAAVTCSAACAQDDTDLLTRIKPIPEFEPLVIWDTILLGATLCQSRTLVFTAENVESIRSYLTGAFQGVAKEQRDLVWTYVNRVSSRQLNPNNLTASDCTQLRNGALNLEPELFANDALPDLGPVVPAPY